MKGLDYKLSRIRRGIKAIDLSKQLGISNVKLSLFENEHVEIPKDVSQKLDEIFK